MYSRIGVCVASAHILSVGTNNHFQFLNASLLYVCKQHTKDQHNNASFLIHNHSYKSNKMDLDKHSEAIKHIIIVVFND